MAIPDSAQMAEDLMLPNTRSDGVLAEAQAYADALVASIVAAKIYAVSLTQSGSADPTGTVIQNGLTGTPTLTRAAPGVYTVNLTGQFTTGKTVVLAANYGSTSPASTTDFDIITAYQVNANQITVTSRKSSSGVITLTDGILLNTNLYVIVFP